MPTVTDICTTRLKKFLDHKPKVTIVYCKDTILDKNSILDYITYPFDFSVDWYAATSDKLTHRCEALIARTAARYLHLFAHSQLFLSTP